MNVAKRVIESRITVLVDINQILYGFASGKSIIHAILSSVHLAKNKDLHFAFVDLEKGV